MAREYKRKNYRSAIKASEGRKQAPLTPKEKHQAIKLLVWLDEAAALMPGAKPNINYAMLAKVWQDLKAIPLTISG